MNPFEWYEGFPIGSVCKGIILDEDQEELNDSYDHLPPNVFCIRIIDKTSGFYRKVNAVLESSEIQIPSLDFAPFYALQVIPIRNLMFHYGLSSLHELRSYKPNPYVKNPFYPSQEDLNLRFIEYVRCDFHNRELTFTVVAHSEYLHVSCEEINTELFKRFHEFCAKLEDIKASLANGYNPEQIDICLHLDETHSANGDAMADSLEGKLLTIDGNNVVRHNEQFGWRVLETLLLCLKRNGVEYNLYFDASVKHLPMDDDGKTFIESQLSDRVHTRICPSKDEADKFILFDAAKTGAHVLSNDGYAVWARKHPWVNVKNNSGDIRRVHKFIVDGDYLSIPDLDIFEKIVDA